MKGIAIKLNDGFLDIEKNEQISFVLNSPVFDIDEILGSYSWDFNVMTTNNNLKLLDFPNIIETSNALAVDYDVVLYLNELVWAYGVLTVMSYNTKIIKCKIRLAESNFKAKTADKYLNEIDYGGAIEVPELYRYTLNYIAGGVVGDSLEIIVGATSYSDNYATSLYSLAVTVAALVNADTSVHGFVVSVKSNGNDPYGTGDELVFLQVKNTVKGIDSTSITINLGGAIYDYDTAIDHIPVSYTNNDYCIKQHMTYMLNVAYYNQYFEYCHWAFPMVYNFLFTDKENYGEKCIYNLYNGPADNYHAHSTDLPVALPYVKFIIKKVLADCGYIFNDDVFDTELSTLVLYNNYGIDNYDEDTAQYGASINIQNHVPKTLSGEFIKVFCNLFCCAIIFYPADRSVRFIPRKKIIEDAKYECWDDIAEPDPEINFIDAKEVQVEYLPTDNDSFIDPRIKDVSQYNEKSPVDSITMLPSSGNSYGDLRLVQDINKYYAYTEGIAPDPDAWVYVADNFTKYGSSSNTVMINTLPLLEDKDFTFVSTVSKLVPVIKQYGTSSILETSNPDFGLRFTFFRGKRQEPGGTGYYYPLAAYDVYNYNYIKIANYSLRLDSDYGLIETWWGKWITFLENLKKEVTFQLPRIDIIKLRNFDWTLKKRIDRTVYLVKQIKFSITTSGFVTAEALMYPVKNFNTVNIEDIPCDFVEFTDDQEVTDVQVTDSISWTLNVNGCCTDELTFSLIDGALPTGLTINPDGTITGTVAEPTGRFDFTIQVTDGCENINTMDFSIDVLP